MLKAVLFDLDGTLLPMDLEAFVKGYLELLREKMDSLGHDGAKIVAAIWKGTGVMAENDGSATNEAAFRRCFDACFPENHDELMDDVEEFYNVDFIRAKSLCSFDPEAAKAVSELKAIGLRCALATNPYFPRIATHMRLGWAGLRPEDFELITTYENSSFSKPNPGYFAEVANSLGLHPEECLMVGNDTLEDAAAMKLGMDFFLITPFMIDRKNLDLDKVPHGSFPDLVAYVKCKMKNGC